MYLVEFVKKQFKRSKIGVLIYLFLNMLFVIGIFSGGFVSLGGVLIGILAYTLSLGLALSPIGEAILRLQIGAKKIQKQDYLNRLMPLFQEVYEKARLLDPSLPKDIKLYINKDLSKNAFATGRKTICLTKGILESSDEEIKATFAHEFGHLSAKDTDLILLITIGNLFATIFFLMYRWTFLIVGLFMGIMNRSLSTVLLTFFVDLILVGMMWLWTKLGTLLVMHSSRNQEYEADRFAHQLGYGESLITLLDSFHTQEIYRKGIFATLVSSHPDPDERIGKLQLLQ